MSKHIKIYERSDFLPPLSVRSSDGKVTLPTSFSADGWKPGDRLMIFRAGAHYPSLVEASKYLDTVPETADAMYLSYVNSDTRVITSASGPGQKARVEISAEIAITNGVMARWKTVTFEPFSQSNNVTPQQSPLPPNWDANITAELTGRTAHSNVDIRAIPVVTTEGRKVKITNFPANTTLVITAKGEVELVDGKYAYAIGNRNTEQTVDSETWTFGHSAYTYTVTSNAIGVTMGLKTT